MQSENLRMVDRGPMTVDGLKCCALKVKCWMLEAFFLIKVMSSRAKPRDLLEAVRVESEVLFYIFSGLQVVFTINVFYRAFIFCDY